MFTKLVNLFFYYYYYFCFFLIFQFLSQTHQHQPQQLSTFLEPTIQITIIVHPYNKYLYLPYVLGGIESQVYPKDRIRLHLLTERIFYEEAYHYDDYQSPDQPMLLSENSDGAGERWFDILLDDRIRQNDETIEMLTKWTRHNRPFYNEIDLTIANVQLNEHLYGTTTRSSREDGGGKKNSYWNKDRFKLIIDTKNQELYNAYQSFVDFILFLDADVILVNQFVLRNLTETFYRQQHKQQNDDMIVLAPMLYSSGTYSNFWGGMDAKGYYVRSDDYIPILERKQPEYLGTFPVPMVHTCFMIDTRKRASRRLTFDPTEVVQQDQSNYYPIPYDDIIAFAKSAAQASIQLYVDNSHIWGYIPQPISDSEWSKKLKSATNTDNELKQALIELEIESLVEGPPFPRSPILESYIEPLFESSDRIQVDQIYVINLRRRPQRRERMEKSLQLLQLKYRLFEATDGRVLTQQYLDQHQIRSLDGYVDPYHKRLITFGEIGCFLSHYRIWEDAWRLNYSKVKL